jgi:outer membrane protein TolC
MCQSRIELIEYDFRNSYWLFLATALFFLPAVSYGLNLEQAEQMALKSDPRVKGLQAAARSYEEESISDSTLPDPKLLLGAVNVPVDSFDLSQEPMTQLKVGIRQDFPRGDSLDIKQQQSQWLSRSAMAQARDARRKLIRDVRQAYLNLYYEVVALEIVAETKKLFSKLVSITESNYAAGRVNQQDVVQASLELSRLDDRAAKIKGMEEGYRAELAQWIGERAWEPINDTFPEIPEVPFVMEANAVIKNHPSIKAKAANVNASRKSIEMARQDYKPGWSASLDYGFRSGYNPDGSSRSDFATALVNFDIPLFTSNRQDRRVTASQEKTNAAQYEMDDKLRQLKRSYEKELHLWRRLDERAVLYRDSLLASARDNTRASLQAYQSGVSEFNTLMRAQITELDVRLEDLRVRVDRASSQARLLYITGESEI